jgi:AGZA family xanthine/uracil permease-like MFS transporter
LFISVPGAATAPALILVGLFMISPVKDIDFDEPTEAIPAFLTILLMVTSYSIANGIMYGALSWIILKLLTGKTKQISPMMVIIAVLLLIKLLIG